MHGLPQVHQENTGELGLEWQSVTGLLQKPDEEILYRCIKSLLKFSLILKGDLLTCIAMVQCDLDATVRSSRHVSPLLHLCISGAGRVRPDRPAVDPAQAAADQQHRRCNLRCTAFTLAIFI